MIVKKLTVHNIGAISHEEIIFEKPLNLFYGQIKVGKTTLAITSIKLLFGGSYPKNILRNDTNEGYVELVFNNAKIKRSFYVDRKFETKARPIEFYMNNSKVQKPADAIQKILNPFLLDQDFLLKKTGLERQRYFVELFGVDTSELDKELLEKTDTARDLRANIKAFGEIVISPIEKPVVENLKMQKNAIELKNLEIREVYVDALAVERKSVDEYNYDVKYHNDLVDNAFLDIKTLDIEIKDTVLLLSKLKVRYQEKVEWLDDPKNQKKEPIKFNEPEKPIFIETVEIEEQISDAKANEILYTQYQDALRKQKEKDYHTGLLRENEARSTKIREEKIKKLAEISETIGVKDLKFNYDGNAIYQGTHMDMLSTSQLIQLKSDCQALYPNELGIELLDKAESLGHSIFDYVGKATKNDLTILATIVGEKPANIPENIGVFVVEDGEIKK